MNAVHGERTAVLNLEGVPNECTGSYTAWGESDLDVLTGFVLDQADASETPL
jgi:hypothetical protein